MRLKVGDLACRCSRRKMRCADNSNVGVQQSEPSRLLDEACKLSERVTYKLQKCLSILQKLLNHQKIAFPVVSSPIPGCIVWNTDDLDPPLQPAQDGIPDEAAAFGHRQNLAGF